MSENDQTIEKFLPASLEEEFSHHVRKGEQINVRALLVLRNIKQIDIADKYHLARAEVNKVINGKRRTQRIRAAIAQELGMPVENIWRTAKSK